MTHPVIEKLVTDNIAYKTRKNTDSLFNLPAGSVSFSGVLMDSIKFVEKSQLLSKETWLLFVDQFRKGLLRITRHFSVIGNFQTHSYIFFRKFRVHYVASFLYCYILSENEAFYNFYKVNVYLL